MHALCEVCDKQNTFIKLTILLMFVFRLYTMQAATTIDKSLGGIHLSALKTNQKHRNGKLFYEILVCLIYKMKRLPV